MIAINNLSFRYPGRETASIREINLRIRAGEFVLLTGPTGCGKSTLLKCLNGIIPHLSGGECRGEILIDGRETRSLTMAQLSAEVGLVQQSPDDQIFATAIQDEVAFGPENLCLPRPEIEQRVEWALKAVELDDCRRRSTAALSGGQKQRLAIAAMLALNPRVLALDEPISQLDPQGANEVMTVVRKLNKDYGVTVVMVEHRIHEVAQFVDRMIVMRDGRILIDAPTREAMARADLFASMGLRLPDTVEISRRFKLGRVAMTVQEAAEMLKTNGAVRTKVPLDKVRFGPIAPQRAIEVRELSYRYGKQDKLAVESLNLVVGRGERVAVMGRNGAGKSTLLAHIAALTPPWRGTVQVAGRTISRSYDLPLGTVGMVMQNPDLMLFQASVRREVDFGLLNLGLPSAVRAERYSRAIESLALVPFQDDPPLALSRGQRLRTAVAAVVAMRPEIVLLDEPTTGQDKRHIDSMMDGLTAQAETLVFCTHDVDTAIRYATRIVVMDGGRIIADDQPRKIFADEALLARSGLRPTQAWLVGKELGIADAFTPADLEEHWRC